jgi:hypothetical protein
MNDALFDELEKILKKYHLDKNNVCLIGGTSLHIHNIRCHRDIDLVVLDTCKKHLIEQLEKKYIKSSGEIILSNNIEVNKGNVFKTVNISDNEIINNSSYHQMYKGYKIVKLELTYSKKLFRCRRIKHFRFKDLYDVFLINNYFKIHNDFDKNLLFYQNISVWNKFFSKIIIFLSKIFALMPKNINKYKQNG